MRLPDQVFDAGARRVMEVLAQPGIMSGGITGVCQVAELCGRFLAVGEAFCNREAGPLRDAVSTVLAQGFDTLHRYCMERLSGLLAQESFKPVPGPDAYNIAHAVAESPIYTPALGEPGARSFEQWVEGGVNPFVSTELVTAASSSTPTAATHSRSQSVDSSAASVVGAGGPGPAGDSVPPSISRVSAAGAGGATGSTGVGSTGGTGASGTGSSMLTGSTRHTLASLEAYGGLVRTLGPNRTPAVWRAVTELYDRYITATFMLLSGVRCWGRIVQCGRGECCHAPYPVSSALASFSD